MITCFSRRSSNFWSDNRKSKIIKRLRGLKLVRLAAIVLAFVGLRGMTQAQQPTKVPRIGFLIGTSASANLARTDSFRQGLRVLGYTEGKNILIEWRYAEGKQDRARELANELVRLKVDIIVTAGGLTTRPAKETTATIPIVMAQDSDAVGNGFVASLARPGGNITGLSGLAPEIGGKRLDLLKEIVPKLSRVAVLQTSTNPADAQMLREVELSAKSFRVTLQYLDVLHTADIEIAFRNASTNSADAALVLGGPVFNSRRTQVVDLAAKNRLPTVYGQPEFMDVGGLMFYGASITDMFRRAATYVDKILKGAKPADLPVEQPTTFEFVINLKTAKALNLTIPQSVLYRADKVLR